MDRVREISMLKLAMGTFFTALISMVIVVMAMPVITMFGVFMSFVLYYILFRLLINSLFEGDDGDRFNKKKVLVEPKKREKKALRP
jgi:hypothetical protein